VGEAAPLIADGRAQANGALMASGYTIGGDAPLADSDVSAMDIDVSTSLHDSYSAPVFADGLVRADGATLATGERGHAVDFASVALTRSWRANGSHAAGDGVVVAKGADQANGSRRCGADALTAAGWTSESLFLI